MPIDQSLDEEVDEKSKINQVYVELFHDNQQVIKRPKEQNSLNMLNPINIQRSHVSTSYSPFKMSSIISQSIQSHQNVTLQNMWFFKEKIEDQRLKQSKHLTNGQEIMA